MDALPLEILHWICSHLALTELKVFRLVCNAFSVIGAEYILSEAHLLFKRDSFERLIEISKHPVISRYVSSLYYEADLLGDLDYDEWDRHRGDWENNSSLQNEVYRPPGGIPRTAREERALRRSLKAYERNRKGKYTKRQLQRHWQAYRELYADQEKIRRTGYDLHALTAAFRGFPRLKDVTISLTNTVRRKTNASDRAFRDALFRVCGDPSGEPRWADECIHQLVTVCKATNAANTPLESLTVGELSYHVLEQPVDEMNELRKVMGKLHSFRMSMDGTKGEDGEPEFEEALRCLSFLESGALREFLAHGLNLRTIKLQLPVCYEVDLHAGVLQDVLGDVTWPRLETLGLTNLDASEEALVAFLIRHQPTLRYLTMSYITLVTGSWSSLFQGIGGQLQLKSVKLRGSLISFDEGPQYELGVPGCQEPRVMLRIRNQIQVFVLQSGCFDDVDAQIEEWSHSDLESLRNFDAESGHDSVVESETESLKEDWFDVFAA